MITCTQQLDEHLEHTFNSHYDDIHERYATELRDIKYNDLAEEEHTEYMSRVWDAGYGCDFDSYEAYWSRLLKYFQDK
jgi:hypothetical protein